MTTNLDIWTLRRTGLARAVRARARNVLSISIERDTGLLGEPESDDTFEYEVEVEFDEGCVHAALITGDANGPVKPPAPVELTANERETAEVDWSDEQVSRWEASQEDAADARADR